MNLKCPQCGAHDVSAEVKTWCRFTAGDPSFDDEDLESVEIVEGGERICHECQHTWKGRRA